MEEAARSLTSRRPAAGALPTFTLPPPNADIPSMLNMSPSSNHYPSPEDDDNGIEEDQGHQSHYYSLKPDALPPLPPQMTADEAIAPDADANLSQRISQPQPHALPPQYHHQYPYRQHPPPLTPSVTPPSGRRLSSTADRYLTTTLGVSDHNISPSLSSVNTGSSHSSQAPNQNTTNNNNMQYSYSGHMHGGWPTPGLSSYTVSSASPAQPSLGASHYSGGGGRPGMYNPNSGLHFSHPRTSQSPATGGEGLPPPPFDQLHQPFQTSIGGSSGGGGGQGSPQGLSSTPQPPQSNILSSQNHVGSQASSSSNASAHADSYTHSRPSYYTTSSAPQHQGFGSYGSQPSATQHSPVTTAPMSRGLGSVSTASTMGPPSPYRPYPTFQHLPAMGGYVMTNIHQPGAQMSMIPGMGMGPYSHHPIMYGHAQPSPQSERPFKCDQCIQSFSRNHDLKRHKRIHLAVKPFPCSYCSKSFSRKDALKRHRLVKGCEGKSNTNNNDNESNGSDRNGDGDDGSK